MSKELQNKKIIFRGNSVEVNHLISIGKKAVATAVRENTALGLSYLITQHNKVIRKNPDGTSEIITTDKLLKSSLKLKKGSILYVKS